MPKLSKLESAARQERVIQDLIVGFPPHKIAEAHRLSVRMVREIQQANRDRIQAGVKVLLDERQKRIDTFLEQEQDDLLEICRAATVRLKQALKALEETAASGMQYFQTEIIIKEQEKPTMDEGKRIPGKDKTIRFKPIHDLETALQAFKDTHSYLTTVQKYGE